MDILIECIEVTKCFKIHVNSMEDNIYTAVENVSFRLYRGDRLGIIGLNGAGKSTLLKIIAGITKPSSGQVIINGQVTSVIDILSYTHGEFTGIENIRLNAKIFGLSDGEIEVITPRIIAISQLEKFIDQPIKTYSAGMCLRLAFAIFMELKPEILLLDETLGTGDINFKTQSEQISNSFFSEIAGVIIVSHQLEEIAKLCNKCMVMDRGRIVFIGETPEALAIYHRNNLKPQATRNTNELTVDEISTTKTSNQFLISEEIVISVRYTKLSDDGFIDPVLYITHNSNPILTDCPIYRQEFKRKIQKKGSYHFLVRIPPFFLNTGQYFVNFIFGDVDNILLEFTNELEIIIKPDEWEKDRKWNSAPTSPIRQQLNWIESYNDKN